MISCLFSDNENWKEEIGAVSKTDDSPSYSVKRKLKNSTSPVIRKVVKRRNRSKTSSDKNRQRPPSKSATEEDSGSADLPAEKSGPGTFRCPFRSCGKLFRISLGKNMTKHVERSHRCSLKVQSHEAYGVIFIISGIFKV
jgi:hypothetical protein